MSTYLEYRVYFWGEMKNGTKTDVKKFIGPQGLTKIRAARPKCRLPKSGLVALNEILTMEKSVGLHSSYSTPIAP